MKTVLARRLIAVACMGAFALIGTACLPAITLQPPLGGNATCPEGGTWTLSSDTITSALSTLLGNATVTPSGTGLTLTLTSGSPDTWSLGGTQTLHIVGTGFDVTATVSPTASGTNTQTGTSGTGGTGSLTFMLSNLTGTAAVTGTVNGQPISFNWPLGQSDDIGGLYGLNATANYTCNSDGTLSLSLPQEQMDFHQ
jgi:hypothetical protein